MLLEINQETNMAIKTEAHTVARIVSVAERYFASEASSDCLASSDQHLGRLVDEVAHFFKLFLSVT